MNLHTKLKKFHIYNVKDSPLGKSKTLPNLYQFLRLSIIYFIRVITIYLRK